MNNKPPEWRFFCIYKFMNPRIKKLVYTKLEDDLFDSFLFQYGNEIWLLNDSKSNWFFRVDSNGLLDYNQKFINSCLSIFTLDSSEKNKLLKDWFEKSTGLSVRSIRRLNSDLDWILEKFNKEKNVWDLKNRNGFAYQTIKKFTTLSERLSLDKISIGNLINDL